MIQIFHAIDSFYLYLRNRNIQFNREGFPIFKKEMFLDEWPECVVPFYNRHGRYVPKSQKTVICFYDKDINIYRRLRNVFEDIPEYRKFMGVVGPDITITDDMDIEWQRVLMLLNQLFLAVLAVNGIKILLNTRSAGLDCCNSFSNIPRGVMVSSGFLGCKCIEKDDFRYLGKIITLMPSRIVLYGKHDKAAETQLNKFGFDYRTYPDYHRLCKGGDKNGR